MYVNYSTEGSAALLDQAKLSLLVWVLCFVLLFVSFYSYTCSMWTFPGQGS